MTRTLAAALAALAGAAAVGTATAAADTTPAPPAGAPSTLYTKAVRMDVSLQDVTGLSFDASLDEVAASMPARFRTYLASALDGEIFSIAAGTATKCFVDDGVATKAATCASVADLVDNAADAVPATVLALATPGAPLDFTAKKLIAHSDGSAALAATKPVKVDVSLVYATGTSSFDATLDGVDSSVPDKLASIVEKRLGDGDFTVDASKAVCSIVTGGSSAKASCGDVADLVDSSYDAVAASAVGTLSTAADGSVTLVVTKLVADADSVTTADDASSWDASGDSSPQGSQGSGGASWWAPQPLPGWGGQGPFGRGR